MGGEITWQCLKSGPNVGQYVFTLKVYRDCNGITVSTISQTLTEPKFNEDNTYLICIMVLAGF